MTLYYNAKVGGFYDSEIHTVIPEGSVEITPREHSHLLDRQSAGDSIVPDANGRPVARPPKTPNLDEYKAAARSQIEAKRRELEARGMPYTFPTGVVDQVQLRNERDLLNINGLVTRAQMALTAGVAAEFPFQSESNTTYVLSAADVVSLGVAVSDFCAALYAKSWSLKAQVSAATTKREVDQAKVWVNI